jgi:hypothetical protein
MKKSAIVSLLLFSGVSAVVAALPSSAPASTNEEEYLAALKIAHQKIERERAAHATRASSENALSSSLLVKLMGRYYRVGDRWDVAAWNFDNPAMRRTSDPTSLQSRPRRGGLFRYEVVEVKNTTEPEVVIHVTQLSESGMKPVDPKVEKLILRMNDRMMQSLKAYQIQGHPGLTHVSPTGVRSPVTPLELFPLDVPELFTAVQMTPEKMPELPREISEISSRLGVKMNLSQSLWFEQDDVFGRPIQALWERGNPWPSYFRTAHGVALLVRGVQ